MKIFCMASMELMKEDVQLSTVETFTSKVMVAWVEEIKRNKFVFEVEVLDESEANMVSWVTVCIASNIDW